ncbi:MAG TPA: sigma-70 family RNA polymerase sigma factor [Nitrolancea sp.]|nr:sigma-70 family RNA polymerase sigma factor [Nitrolancea sp.]
MVDVEHAITVANRWRRERNGDAEGEIVARIAAGDRQALDTLYQRHAQALYGYLLTLTADHGLAEEILQDTFVAAWRAAERFEARSSVKTWLFGIARRQAHNSLRRRQLARAGDDALEEATSTEPEPEAAALRNADRQALSDAIARLQPVHREVLVLAFVHELSYAEMADLLDVPLGTIRSRLSNARRLLRQILDGVETER